jgi:hypothetical protein
MSIDQAATDNVRERIERLDVDLFSTIWSQTDTWDRRALLALHATVANRLGSFSYLEVGSYLGGSLQAVMQDARCSSVMSIDPRPPSPPDTRGGSRDYEDNSTARMRELLGGLPQADMSKLQTFEVGTDGLQVRTLPVRPDYCFIDGEHTDAAALRDARFCAEALGRSGIIAFHDYGLITDGIRAFVREEWRNISRAVVFTGSASDDGGGVFALELGDRAMLRGEIIERAVGSGWHMRLWELTSRPRHTPVPFLLAWSTVPRVDRALSRLR